MSDSGDQRDRYAQSGVDIAAGNAFVDRIKPLARSTARPGADGDLGGFGGLFDLAACGYRDPVLVAATDGVGTKIMLAEQAGHHRALGIDLVAMCVNDLIVQGAEPLFFLDYLATGKLGGAHELEILDGIAAGCREAGCALIGGETAEMPGHYPPGRSDLAGFAVGAVERDRILTGAGIRPGDRLLGLASNGPHANGFSLIRRILAETAIDITAPFAGGASLAAQLMAPTRIYVQALRAGDGIKGLAHITGGGLIENLPRILAAGLGVEIDMTAWPKPAVFRWLQSAGAIPGREMARVFNCGIGMVAIVAAEDCARIRDALAAAGETVTEIGTVVPHKGDGDRVRLSGSARAWQA